MVAYTQQHFVPQFYLKNFSLRSERRQIGLYLWNKLLYVESARIKREAVEENFYHNVEIEKALGLIESAAATLIQKILCNDYCPERFSTDHHLLMTFTLFQWARTKRAAMDIDELNERLMKNILNGRPEVSPEQLKKVRIRMNNPAGMALSHAAASEHVVCDLKFKILKNLTLVPFVTSDNPVVLYNQFFEPRRPFGSTTGLACKGLQMFMPLSPKWLIVFFDEEVYAVGSQRHSVVDLVKNEDVLALNLLQAANSHDRLYFNEQIGVKAISALVQKAAPLRRKTSSIIREGPRREANDGTYRSIVHSYRVDLQTNLRLSCFRVRKAANRYEMGNRAVHVRNEELMQMHQQFDREVAAGIFKQGEFGKFLLHRRNVREI